MNDSYHETATSNQAGLQINMTKRTYVLPWSQFLFAEGDADEIRIAFSTHDVIITGGKLDTMLMEIADQRITLIKEPVRAELFASFSGLHITGISIKKSE